MTKGLSIKLKFPVLTHLSHQINKKNKRSRRS